MGFFARTRAVTGGAIDGTAEWFDKSGKFVTVHWVKGRLAR